MKLSDWASIAEILSGVAVVVTLVFLVVGLRANTNATHAVVYKDLLIGINDFNQELINDSELARLWSSRTSLSMDAMEAEDADRIRYMNRILYRIYDSAYFAFKNGSLSAAQWERFRNIACPDASDENSRLGALWRSTRPSVSPDFVQYIEADCPR